MPTATKSRVKTKKVVSSVAPAAEETEGEADILPAKIKKPLEIDELEPVAVVDEKVEEDPLIAATEEEEVGEEAVLDTEDLNPFGDRWEE